MIKIPDVYQIDIPLNDVERCVKFYTEIPGVTITKLNNDNMGNHLNRADLTSGSSVGALLRCPKATENNAPKGNGATRQAFVVAREFFDLAAEKMNDGGWEVYDNPTFERLTGKGFNFLPPTAIYRTITRRRGNQQPREQV